MVNPLYFLCSFTVFHRIFAAQYLYSRQLMPITSTITSQQLQCSYRIMGSSVIGIGLGTQRDYFIFIMSDSHTPAV